MPRLLNADDARERTGEDFYSVERVNASKSLPSYPLRGARNESDEDAQRKLSKIRAAKEDHAVAEGSDIVSLLWLLVGRGCKTITEENDNKMPSHHDLIFKSFFERFLLVFRSNFDPGLSTKI